MRWIKLTLLLFVFAIVILLGVLSFPGGQKALLKVCLKPYFNTVKVENLSIGFSKVVLDGISLQKDEWNFEIGHAAFDWTPLKALIQRGLSIRSLRADIQVKGPLKSNELRDEVASEKGLAGIQWPFKKKKPLKGLLTFMQPPVKLLLEEAEINLKGCFDEQQTLQAKLAIHRVLPAEVGTFDYQVDFQFSPNQTLRKLVAKGNGQILSNAKGKFTKFRNETLVRFDGKRVTYAPLNVRFFSERPNAVDRSETMQLEVHYGSSTDITLSCDLLSKGNRSMVVKWQGEVDHSFLKILYPNRVPLFSLMAEGELSLNRSLNTLANHFSINAWIKKLERLHPSLKPLPMIGIKAQVDTTLKKDQLNVNQLSFVVKDKVTKRPLMSGNLLHALFFNWKLGRLLPLEESTKVFETSFYELPSELLNPFLAQWNWEMGGTLSGGNFEFAWNKPSNQWCLSSVQPMQMQGFDLKQLNNSLIKGLNLKATPELSVDSKFKHFAYKTHAEVLDQAYHGVFVNRTEGQGKLSGTTLESIELKGQLSGNVRAISQQPFWSLLGGELVKENLEFRLSYEGEGSQKLCLINHFDALLQEKQKEVPLLQMGLARELTFDPKKVKEGILPEIKGKILDIKAKDFPLGLLSPLLTPIKLDGFLSYEGELKAQDNHWSLISGKPFRVQNLLFRIKTEEALETLLDCKQLSFTPSFDYYSGNAIKTQVDDLFIGNPSDKPLLCGNVECTLKNTANRWRASKGSGSLSGVWENWFLQPWFINLPSFAGDFSVQWSHDKTLEGSFKTNLSPLKSDFFVETSGSVKGTIDTLDNFSLKGDWPLSIKSNLGLTAVTVAFDCQHKKNDTNVELKLKGAQIYLEDMLGVGFWLQNGKQAIEAWALKLSAMLNSRPSAASTQNTQVVSNDLNLAETQAPVETGRQEGPSKNKAPGPFWAPIRGNFSADIKSVIWDKYAIEKILMDANLSETALHLKNLSMEPWGGRLNGSLACNWRPKNHDYALQIKALAENFWTSDGLYLCERFYPSAICRKLNVLEGPIHLKVNLEGEGPMGIDLAKSLKGSVYFLSPEGILRPLKAQSTTSKALVGLTSTLGLVLGAKINEMGTLGFLVSYCQAVPYRPLEVVIERDDQYRIWVKKALLKNDEIVLSAEGYLDQAPDKAWNEQAVNLETSLKAKGGQITHYIAFDKENRDVEGYYQGPKIPLRGTLKALDYSEFLTLLEKRPVPALSPSKKNVEEKQGSENSLEKNLRGLLKSIF